MLWLRHFIPPVVCIIRILKFYHRFCYNSITSIASTNTYLLTIQHSIYHQLGHGQSLLVEVRVLVLAQQGHFGDIQSSHDVHFVIVRECPRPAPVLAELVVCHADEVNGIQHHWDDGHHSEEDTWRGGEEVRRMELQNKDLSSYHTI